MTIRIKISRRCTSNWKSISFTSKQLRIPKYHSLETCVKMQEMKGTQPGGGCPPWHREGVSWPIKIARQVERTCFKRGAFLARIPAPFPDGLVGLCLHKASGHHSVLQSAAPRASSLHIVSFDSLNYSLSPDKYYCSHKDVRNKLRETKYPAQCFIATFLLEPTAELQPSRPKPVVYWILLLFLHKNAEK